MRLECDSCRELVDGSFELAGGAVLATCSVCRHVMTAPLAAATPAQDTLRCPTCGAARGDAAAACPSCGLAADRTAAYTDARDVTVPAAVSGAWTRATERWTDTSAHDELLRLVASHNCYAWAAGRYRAHGRDAVTLRQLDRLRRAAEATLMASATTRPDAAAAPYRATRNVLAILIVAIVAGLLYAAVMGGGTPPPDAPSIPARTLTPGHPISPSTIK